MIEFPSKHKDNSEKATGLLFMRTYNKWHSEIKRQLNPLGLTHPQFVILTTLGYLLQSETEVTQVMLARMSGMDVMSVSQIVHLLEKHGWITRQEHSKDTRAKSASLTLQGQEMLKKALPVVEQIDLTFFSALGDGEAAFTRFLHELSDAWGDS